MADAKDLHISSFDLPSTGLLVARSARWSSRMENTQNKRLAEELCDPNFLVKLARESGVLPRLPATALTFAKAAHQFLTRHRVVEKLHECVQLFDAARRKVEASPPSPGYEPLLINRGLHPLFARLFARHVVALGRRKQLGNNEKQILPAALRRLSRPGRRRNSTVAGVAVELRALPNAEVAILAMFSRVGALDEGQRFVALLDAAAAADPIACRELACLARTVEGQIETRRGRKVTLPSATHELLLTFVNEQQQHVAYTFNPIEDRFTDPVTSATRIEFELQDFDPRPAVKRLKQAALKH